MLTGQRTYVAVVARPSRLTDALSLQTVAVVVAVRHRALVGQDAALRPLPALLAVAHAAPVLSIAAAQQRADACKKTGI